MYLQDKQEQAKKQNKPE